MKSIINILGGIIMTTLMLTSCSPEEEVKVVASAQEFEALKQGAIDNLTQQFQFDAADVNITLTSDNGVEININTNCLTLNGNPVTGMIDLEYMELFEKGNMLITNKPTMGALLNGDKALLISGGEFFIEATQGGQALDMICDIQLVIPASLTGGPDNAMTLWEGRIDADDNLTWDEDVDPVTGQGGVFVEGGQYYAFLNEFGFSNVDRFYNDARPKTTILVDVPEGYDNTNCNIYLSYDGEDTGLASLDTYNAGTGLFSEHYGQIPVGLECHIIFITEEDGLWKYAVKGVTIAADDIFVFTDEETSVVTQAQIVTNINGLP